VSVKQIIGIVIALLVGGAIALYASMQPDRKAGSPTGQSASTESAPAPAPATDVAAKPDAPVSGEQKAESAPATAEGAQTALTETAEKAEEESASAKALAEAKALAKAKAEAAAKAVEAAKAQAEAEARKVAAAVAADAKAKAEAEAQAKAEARAKAEAEALAKAQAEAEAEAAARAEAEARAKAEAEAALAKAQAEAAARAEAEARAKAEAEAALAKAQAEAAARAEAEARAKAEAEAALAKAQAEAAAKAEAEARAKAEADKAAADALAKAESEDKPAGAVGPNATGGVRLPAFDVAEVNPDGMMVIAGVASPGAEVRLIAANGDVLARTLADADGAFAFLPETPLPLGDSALRLAVSDDGGAPVYSEETIIVSRSGGGAAPLIVLQSEDATTPSKVLQRPDTAPKEAVARLEDKAGAGGGVGGSADDKPVKTEDSGLAVGAIDYDSSGRLALRGVAPPGSNVTVEVDGAAVAKTTANAAGDWTATTGAGAADGASRIDATAQTNAGGAAARPLRVSLPFAPAGIIQDFPQGRMVIVQPGNSLWRIARRTYGDGLRYTVIYSANRGQIMNPDLIYPGQILHAPKPREG